MLGITVKLRKEDMMLQFKGKQNQQAFSFSFYTLQKHRTQPTHLDMLIML